MSVAEHQRESLAIRMLQVGLRPTIVESVTCLNRKRVLNLRSSMGMSQARGGAMPSANTICLNAERTLEASLFIKLYSRIATNPADEVDIEAFIEAHAESQRLHKEARCGRLDQDAVLDADESYVLARDFRQGTIWLEYCGDCRIEFLVSDRQFGRSALYACPCCVGRSGGNRRGTPKPAATPAAPVEFVIEASPEAPITPDSQDAVTAENAPLRRCG